MNINPFDKDRMARADYCAACSAFKIASKLVKGNAMRTRVAMDEMPVSSLQSDPKAAEGSDPKRVMRMFCELAKKCSGEEWLDLQEHLKNIGGAGAPEDAIGASARNGTPAMDAAARDALFLRMFPGADRIRLDPYPTARQDYPRRTY